MKVILMQKPPKRIAQHEIDAEACKYVATLFDRSWELRDLTGRDFGIDKIAERFENGYSTSELLLLQIKGSEKPIDASNPHFSLETKTLLYAEMFNSPFLVLYCSILQPNKCYYLWVQEYIKVRLNYDNKNWRNQGTNTIYFPMSNILGSEESFAHLQYISKFPKYKDSWIEYYTILKDLCYDLPNVYDIESTPIFVDRNKLNMTTQYILDKLDAATIAMPNIPSRFIPDCFQHTTTLARSILENKQLPSPQEIQRLIINCQTIEKSVAGISLRFNSKHSRFLFEFDGTADY